MMQPKSRRFLDLAIDKLGDKYGDPMRHGSETKSDSWMSYG